jgi:hypothetical protein
MEEKMDMLPITATKLSVFPSSNIQALADLYTETLYHPFDQLPVTRHNRGHVKTILLMSAWRGRQFYEFSGLET